MSSITFVTKINRAVIPGATVTEEYCDPFRGDSCCTDPDTIGCGASMPDSMFVTFNGVNAPNLGYDQAISASGDNGQLTNLTSLRNQSYRVKKVESWSDSTSSLTVYILADSEIVGKSDLIYMVGSYNDSPGLNQILYPPGGQTHQEFQYTYTPAISSGTTMFTANGSDVTSSFYQSGHPPLYSPLVRDHCGGVDDSNLATVLGAIAFNTNSTPPVVTSLTPDFTTNIVHSTYSGNNWFLQWGNYPSGTRFNACRMAILYGGIYLSRTDDVFSVPCEIHCLGRNCLDPGDSCIWGDACSVTYGGTLENRIDHPSPSTVGLAGCDPPWFYNVDYLSTTQVSTDSRMPVFWSVSGGDSIDCGPRFCCASVDSFNTLISPFATPQGVTGSTSWSGSTTTNLGGGVTQTIDDSGSTNIASSGPEATLDVYKQLFVVLKCVEGLLSTVRVIFSTELVVHERGEKTLAFDRTVNTSNTSVGFVSSDHHDGTDRLVLDRHKIFPYINHSVIYSSDALTVTEFGVPYVSIRRDLDPVSITLSP